MGKRGKKKPRKGDGFRNYQEKKQRIKYEIEENRLRKKFNIANIILSLNDLDVSRFIQEGSHLSRA